MVLSALSFHSSTVHLVCSLTTIVERHTVQVSCCIRRGLFRTVVHGSTLSLILRTASSFELTVVVSCLLQCCCVLWGIPLKKCWQPFTPLTYSMCLLMKSA